MRTFFFSNCIAAFEGGGVKGAAYAGAYSAAVAAGIRFSAVAGSSAGAVIAALIAAGASESFLRERMLSTDFSKLVDKPKRDLAPYSKAALPKYSLILKYLRKDLFAALEAGGQNSTEEIGRWVEKNLRDAMKDQCRQPPAHPIRFKDLVMPLYIVATDVAQRKPKLWGPSTTPDESVSLAVQSSCAIPIFFQPVTTDSSVLVDGGAISNLPTFVFPEGQGGAGRFSEKTLAFRLKSTPKPHTNRFESALDYAMGVADTLVTSATSIQQSLQKGVFPVEIDAGAVRATDFSLMTAETRRELYDSGYSAVEDFISNEREIVGKHRIGRKFRGYDERLHAYVHAFTEARTTIWISDSSTYWLWFIFPALASAIRRGVQVRMLAAPQNGPVATDEAKRRKLLAAMGCAVSEGTIGFTGVLVDYPGEHAIAAISSERGVVGSDFEYDDETVRIYTGESDLPVINSIGASLSEKVGATGSGGVEAEFGIEQMSEGELFSALRTVRHYEEARFEIADLKIDSDLRISQTKVKEFKLLQVSKLTEELNKSGIQLFHPCRYSLPNGSKSIITPPVVEMTRQGPVIIEGHTRAYHAILQGDNRMKVVIAHDVKAALPVEPRPFGDLRLSYRTIDLANIMPGYNRSLLRNIEGALHP
ncbi:MAG: patatin-like phospholipase family protein [Celeribacter sp.]|jgi:predicted acylesterase/phospholipase RssA